MGCPLVPAWGFVVLLAEGLGLLVGAPGWFLAIGHAGSAAATPAVWRALGRAPLAARRAGWIALAVPGCGALAAAWLPAGGGRVQAVEALGEPRLGPLEAAPPPEAERGVWELAALLASPALEDQLAAVAGLTALPGCEGVPALRAALTAGEPQAALLASLALAEVEEGLEAAVAAARARAQGLVAALRAYAESGLPAPAAAAGAWRELLALDPGPADRAAAHFALGAFDEALAAADAAEATDADAGHTRLRALFALGDVARLPGAARQLRAIAPLHSPAHAAATYWVGA
jgi:hypothetical protein